MSSEEHRQAGPAALGRALGYDPDDPATWPGAEPGTAGPPAPPAAEPKARRSRELTDAKTIRALAHPLRVTLLEMFGYHQTLTATQASELLGESPANCAFHLRTLAKYGFLREAGGGRGRERPWTLVDRVVHFNSRQEDPQVNLATEELGRVMLDQWIDRARQAYGTGAKVPGWDRASGWTLTHAFMTPEETEAVREQMRGLLERFEPRQADPALRPPGARPVEWTMFASPVAEWTAPDDEHTAPGDEHPAPGTAGATES